MHCEKATGENVRKKFVNLKEILFSQYQGRTVRRVHMQFAFLRIKYRHYLNARAQELANFRDNLDPAVILRSDFKRQLRTDLPVPMRQLAGRKA